MLVSIGECLLASDEPIVPGIWNDVERRRSALGSSQIPLVSENAKVNTFLERDVGLSVHPTPP